MARNGAVDGSVLQEIMNNKGAVIFGSFLVGIWLLSNPRCNRGCRSVAEHLVNHAIDDFLASLL